MDSSDNYIKSLSQTNLFRSVFLIIIEWSIIGLCIGIYLIFHPYSYFVLPILIFIIGTRIYAFYSLLHDALHYLIVKNKKLNDWIARIFIAWPIFISVNQMRSNHFSHHKNFYTEKDPELQLSKYDEFRFPLKKKELLKILILDLSGVNFIRYKFHAIQQNRKELFIWGGVILFSLMLYIIHFYTVLQVFLLLWIIPYTTVFQILNRLRAYTEHFNLPEGVKTRNLIISPALSFFVAPHSLGYHEAHHLYPYIPQYNLKKLHNYLITNGMEMYEEHSLRDLIKKIYK